MVDSLKIIRKYLYNKNNAFTIFLFHGVIKENKFQIRNYNNKHIKIEKFKEILKFLKKRGCPINFDELIYKINNKKKFRPRTFLISFDDGFYNNFENACPILKKLKIPAIFFLSTDFIENNSLSWIDKIEHLFEQTKKKAVFIKEFNKTFKIDGKAAKIKILDLIRLKVKNNFKININQFVNGISKSLRIKVPNHLNTEIDKKLKWNDVKKIKNNNLFTIGGHSHLHHSLGYLKKNKIYKSQIKKSINLFYKRIGYKLKYYSYPEGQKIDFNRLIINELKSYKIVSCPTAIPGYNKANQNLFKLYRVQL
jgi:peptidoglycan/xylan/chitin deacetylase (PgdA/CDA1 family)